jgi:hypothetical protein
MSSERDVKIRRVVFVSDATVEVACKLWQAVSDISHGIPDMDTEHGNP